MHKRPRLYDGVCRYRRQLKYTQLILAPCSQRQWQGARQEGIHSVMGFGCLRVFSRLLGTGGALRELLRGRHNPKGATRPLTRFRGPGQQVGRYARATGRRARTRGLRRRMLLAGGWLAELLVLAAKPCHRTGIHRIEGRITKMSIV
eukprot:scaffold30_cov416-Prasinococcus_capsulatus_cf.AAC.34